MRGRSFPWVIGGFALAVLAVAASFAGEKDGLAAGEVAEATAGSSIDVRGDDDMLPLMRRAAEAYMAEHPDMTIVVSGGGAVRGAKALAVGVSEIAMATDELPDELGVKDYVEKNRIPLAKIELYRDAIVPVVHSKNPVGNLSLAQLRDVFTGKITNWKDVGGKDAKIKLLTQESDTGDYEIFREDVLGDELVMPSGTKTVVDTAMEQTFTENSISFIGMTDTGSLKALSVDGVVASIATVIADQFPIQRQACLWVRQPASPAVRAFVAYLLQPEKGMAWVKEIGDVPTPGKLP